MEIAMERSIEQRREAATTRLEVLRALAG